MVNKNLHVAAVNDKCMAEAHLDFVSLLGEHTCSGEQQQPVSGDNINTMRRGRKGTLYAFLCLCIFCYVLFKSKYELAKKDYGVQSVSFHFGFSTSQMFALLL